MLGIKNNYEAPPSKKIHKSICSQIHSPMHGRILENVVNKNELLYHGIIVMFFCCCLSLSLYPDIFKICSVIIVVRFCFFFYNITTGLWVYESLTVG